MPDVQHMHIVLENNTVLTVLCVDTSSGDFIKDHVLGTTREAALHTKT